MPSYIYYGVNNVEDVIIARIGVPRFAISIIKNILISKKVNINISNMTKITQEIKNITIKELERYTNNSKLIKSLLDKYVR